MMRSLSFPLLTRRRTVDYGRLSTGLCRLR
jgi:hypothetical protein